MDISIIIPAYNEAKRIVFTIERTMAFMNQRNWTYELLIVDDGSVDGTADQVEKRAGDDPVLRCIRNPANRG